MPIYHALSRSYLNSLRSSSYLEFCDLWFLWYPPPPPPRGSAPASDATTALRQSSSKSQTISLLRTFPSHLFHLSLFCCWQFLMLSSSITCILWVHLPPHPLQLQSVKAHRKSLYLDRSVSIFLPVHAPPHTFIHVDALLSFSRFKMFSNWKLYLWNHK